MRVGITGRYHTDDLPEIILQDISEGLTKIDDAGQVTAGLAKSWETNDNGKTWIFHLDENKFWQDGKKVSSETVQYSFENVPIERPDSSTLVFRLESPFAPFPSVVAKSTFKKGLLGTGEWRVVNLSLVGSYVERLSLVNKNGDKKVVKFYPTEERVKLAFKLGEVDAIYDLIDPKPFDKWGVVKLSQIPDLGRYVAVFFNTKVGLLGNKDFRQALSYATDKEILGYERAISPLSPLSWAYNPQVKPYSFDQERARELIKDMDLPKEQKENLSVKLTTTPVLLEIAEKIAGNWGEVGVKTTLQVTSNLPTEYEAFLAIYDIPSDPDQYSTWHSTQLETNITKYSNPRIDKLLEDGRLELDQEKRKAIYFDFQRFLLEDAPVIFLYHPISFSVQREQ